MGYRPRVDFDQPDAESVQQTRRRFAWILPLILIQQGTAIFREGLGLFSQIMTTAAWATVTLSILWMLLELPLPWMSERDRAVLGDEWSRSVSGDASRWGIAAFALIGCGMMMARLWVPLDAGLAIYGLVNGALIVAVLRYAWLNRAEPGEDE